MFCFHPYFVQIWENTVQKNPAFTVVLCSEKVLLQENVYKAYQLLSLTLKIMKINFDFLKRIKVYQS